MKDSLNVPSWHEVSSSPGDEDPARAEPDHQEGRATVHLHRV